MGRLWFLILLLIVGCQSEEKKNELFKLNKINYSTIYNNIDCKELIRNSPLTENLVNNFLKLVDVDSQQDSIERLILMFHSEERGGIIESNNISIIVSKNQKIESNFYVNQVKVKTKKSAFFDSKQFYEFLSNIEEEIKVNSSNLFVINIDGKNIQCSTYNNLKFEKTKEIKELVFMGNGG